MDRLDMGQYNWLTISPRYVFDIGRVFISVRSETLVTPMPFCKIAK